MRFSYDDGGREAAGFSGKTGDCVTRAIAIATEQPYQSIYDAINAQAKGMRQTKRVRGSAARTGVSRTVYERYLAAQGWKWTPTMRVGSGCTVHLTPDELPKGRIIVRLSGHLAAVIDGVLHDTFDCSRDGTRCVYGYWSKA
jgi:hypothetical protein